MTSLIYTRRGKVGGKAMEKHFSLVTLDRVREWKTEGKSFRISYELIGYSPDKKPRYNVIYLFRGKEYILVKARISESGADPRVLNLWPGVYNHHKEFGAGTVLKLQTNDEILTEPE